MSCKYLLACVALAAVCGMVQSVELIDLSSDATRNLFKMDMLKSLESVQGALETGFRFDTVAEAKDFLGSCKYLQGALKSTKDEDYDGLGKQIKALMNEPELIKPCAIPEDTLSAFEAFDETFESVRYMSARKLRRFQKYDQLLNENPDAKFLLASTIKNKEKLWADRLLSEAADSIESFFSSEEKPKSSIFDMTPKYKSKCEISEFKPLCRLVRRSRFEDGSANGADFQNYAQLLRANNVEQLKAYETDSAVSSAKLLETCEDLNDDIFRPFQRISDYLQRGYLQQEQVDEQLKTDSGFHFYYHANELCKIVLKAN